MSFEIIDGYCHCGLRKYRPIEDLNPFMDRLGFSRAVLVQHLGEYDNSYIESIVARDASRYAGVMLVDPDGPAPADQLARWAKNGTFRGIRLLARTLRSHPDVWQCADRLGLNIVVYEQPTIATYADDLREFASRHPQTRLVISHLGVLDRSESPRFEGHRRLCVLSDRPNVYVQLSGFHMFGEYPYRDQLAIVEQLVAWFGPSRLLYGTNYPLPKDEEAARRELELMRSGKLGVHLEAIEQVLSRTALDLWFN